MAYYLYAMIEDVILHFANSLKDTAHSAQKLPFVGLRVGCKMFAPSWSTVISQLEQLSLFRHS